MPRRTVSVEDLSTELVPILRAGLPVTDETAGDVLPQLTCVYARAETPESRLSRIKAFNQLLEELFANLDDTDPETDALRTLFAVDLRWRGRTLTDREIHVATLLERAPDYIRQKPFRQRQLRRIAMLIQHENAKYRQVRTAWEIRGRNPKLTEDDFSAYEEAASRIWSEVWGLRAEMIAAKRRLETDSDAQSVTPIVYLSLWHFVRLRLALDNFLERFGDQILQGSAAYNAHSLNEIAGWRPGFSDEEVEVLKYTLVRSGLDHADRFIDKLQSTPMGQHLRDRWDSYIRQM